MARNHWHSNRLPHRPLHRIVFREMPLLRRLLLLLLLPMLWMFRVMHSTTRKERTAIQRRIHAGSKPTTNAIPRLPSPNDVPAQSTTIRNLRRLLEKNTRRQSPRHAELGHGPDQKSRKRFPRHGDERPRAPSLSGTKSTPEPNRANVRSCRQ